MALSLPPYVLFSAAGREESESPQRLKSTQRTSYDCPTWECTSTYCMQELFNMYARAHWLACVYCRGLSLFFVWVSATRTRVRYCSRNDLSLLYFLGDFFPRWQRESDFDWAWEGWRSDVRAEVWCVVYGLS